VYSGLGPTPFTFLCYLISAFQKPEAHVLCLTICTDEEATRCHELPKNCWSAVSEQVLTTDLPIAHHCSPYATIQPCPFYLPGITQNGYLPSLPKEELF
jgi:hypothetical protein